MGSVCFSFPMNKWYVTSQVTSLGRDVLLNRKTFLFIGRNLELVGVFEGFLL